VSRQLLTSRTVAVAKPARNAVGAPVRREIPDGMGLGLYLAIETTGAKSWVLRCRDRDGRSIRRKLGDVADMTLAAARAAAAKARHQVELQAPVTVQPVAGRRGDRIEDDAVKFLELHMYKKTRASTARTAERIFNRLVLPAWSGRTIESIRRRDVIELVEQIAERNGGYMANRTLGHLSKWFNWMVGRDMLDASPVAGCERPFKEKVRSRTLTDAEVRALWLAAEGDQFGPALRMLVICGARRNEVSLMVWDEIDLSTGVWTLPAARAKNGVEHRIKLPRQALDIIAAQPRRADCPYIFPGRVGRTGLIGWDKAKRRLSAKAGVAEAGWRLHDLRRSCAAGMQKLGIAVPVIERALNHKSGTFRGIVGTYQTHDYADEVAIALQRWADRLDEIVANKPAKVIRLPKRK
jgi:integrase